MSTASLLKKAADLSHLADLPNWTSNLQSSYDRTGGNGDAANFVSTTGHESILAEMDGPGAIVRIWAANPSGTLKIYIDGAQAPVIETSFQDFFTGAYPPFKAPLCARSSAAFYSYLPIPYAHHCKVVVENAIPAHGDVLGLYYHVNFLTFPAGTPVKSFTLPLDAEDQAAVDVTNAIWSSAVQPKASLPALSHPTQIPPGKTVVLASYKGAGVIRSLAIALPKASDADLRVLIFRGYFDGHTTPDIEAPVADFFGNAYGRKPFRTLLLGCAQDGSFEARFPMPFARSARFTLTSGAANPLTVSWHADLVRRSFDPAQTGYFHASWSQEITQMGKPHVWVHAAKQRGRLVGVAQAMHSRGSLVFLEGDDQFRVDSQSWQPSQVATTTIGPWNGTGAEDFFNCGYYFGEGPNSQPANACLIKDGLDGKIDCLRWLFLDAPTFASSIDGQIEHGGANDYPGAYYSSVTYWYSNGAVHPWSSLPPMSQLVMDSLLPPQFAVPQAIEGESLLGTAKASAGSITLQELLALGNGWSHGMQLWWSGGHPQDTLTLPLTPPAAGTYALVGYFTKASDYGQISFQLNGQPLRVNFDGYAPKPSPSGPIALGTVSLPAGSSTLVITVTGKNELASNYFAGIDALALNAPGETPIPLPTK